MWGRGRGRGGGGDVHTALLHAVAAWRLCARARAVFFLPRLSHVASPLGARVPEEGGGGE